VFAVVLIALFGFMGIKVVPEKNMGVIFRGGKFLSLKKPGMVFLIPIYDRYSIVTYEPKDLNIPQQMIIVSDKEKVYVSGTLSIKMKEPEKAYPSGNYEENLVVTAGNLLKEEVSKSTYSNLKASWKEFEEKILKGVKEKGDVLGIDIRKVRIIIDR